MIPTLSMMRFTPDETKVNESLWGDPRGYDVLRKEQAEKLFAQWRQENQLQGMPCQKPAAAMTM